MLDLGFKSWMDATVVFMNSTCYDDELMLKLAHLASKSECESVVFVCSCV